MSINLSVEDYIRQRLGDRDLNDYFPAAGELSAICWRAVVCRNNKMTLDLTALETKATPLPTPEVTSVGSFWAYVLTQYIPNAFAERILSMCSYDAYLHQATHKYALFQANIYVDGVFYSPQPDIDEIALLAEFPDVVSGVVTLVGYPINLNRVMYDVLTAIADDSGKLGIYQSTIGGSTDLREAANIAQKRAGSYLRGTTIPSSRLKGFRR